MNNVKKFTIECEEAGEDMFSCKTTDERGQVVGRKQIPKDVIIEGFVE